MKQKRKDIKDLKVTISHYKSSLRRARVQPEATPASEDNPSDSEAKGAKEAEMVTTPVADDAPPVNTTPEPLTPPPGEEQTHSMEVDDGDDCQPPVGPISYREDELLTGSNAVGVEGEMANLKVSSPGGYEVSNRGASA